MTVKFLLVFTIFALPNCKSNGRHSGASASDSSKVFERITSQNGKENFGITEISSGTAYKNKNYKFTLALFDTINNFPDQSNTIFTFKKLVDGQYKTIYTDSIYCQEQELKFENFTPDNIKSILVRNNADIRSNWTYYLYLVDTAQDSLKKIKGFEEIKNPNYLSQYNLIDNNVMSGKNWTSFYKIKGDSIEDFDIVVYDDQTDNGNYDRDYKKAIKSILVREKNNR